MNVKLLGGPFDGQEVSSWGTSLVCEGTGVPDGMVARYGPTRTRPVYRFRGWDRVVATLPLPGPEPAGEGS